MICQVTRIMIRIIIHQKQIQIKQWRTQKFHGTGKYKNTTLTQFKQKRARFDANATITSSGVRRNL